MEARHCLALVLGTCIWSPVIAATDTDSLVREMRRLSQRVEQLEAANRRLEAAQNQSATAPGSDTTERLEDVEQEVRKMSQPGKLEQALEGVSAEASLTMVGQRALQGTVSGKDESQLNYRADVEVSLPGGRIGDAEGKIFAQFRMGQGNGLADLNPTLTGSINSTAFQLTNGDDTAAILAQAWYQLDIPVGGARTGELGQAEITLGKIDPFIFFDQNALADDESEAFLNNVFVHNPLLDSGGTATSASPPACFPLRPALPRRLTAWPHPRDPRANPPRSTTRPWAMWCSTRPPWPRPRGATFTIPRCGAARSCLPRPSVPPATGPATPPPAVPIRP